MMIGPTHFIKARRQSEHTCMPRYMAIMRRLITEINNRNTLSGIKKVWDFREKQSWMDLIQVESPK